MDVSNIATLGIEFTMTTAGAVTEVGKLGAAVDTATTKAVGAFEQIEAASKAAVNTAAAQAGVSALGDAVGQVSTLSVRAFNQIERAGESMAAQLTRQLSNFGMNATEIRSMRTEAAALAAEGAGQVELAARLRDLEAELYAVELAAARKAEAIAQAAAEDAAAAQAATALDRAAASLVSNLDPLAAAQARAADQLSQLDALFDSGRITLDQYAAAGAKVTAEIDGMTEALDRQAAAEKEATASAAPPTATQTQISSVTGTGFGDATGSAEASARAMAALLAEEEQLEARTKSLVAAIDPLAAAQARANAMVEEARSLYAAGAITAEQLAAAEKLVANATSGHSSALGLNSTQVMIAEGAVHRLADSLLAGMSPMRAVTMQAGDFANILAMDNGGMAGGLAKVSALINPVTIGMVALAVAAAAGVAAWLSYADAIDKFDALAQGAGAVIGATGSALEANAEQAAAAGNVSVSSARSIEAAYVTMGGIGSNVLTGLTAVTSDFAKATGQDLASAEHELGAALQDPAQGVDDLTKKFGTFTQAQIEHIQQLVQQNNLYGAQQALLAGLGPQFDKAAEHANILAEAWHTITTAASDAWTAMGKAIDLALGGGSKLQQIAELTREKDQTLQATMGMGDTSYYDKQIAALQAQLAQEKQTNATAQTRSAAVDVMKTVGTVTGDDQLQGMQTSLAKINALLADTSNKAGLSAAQIAQLKTAQQDYSHAVETYLPEGQKEVELAQLSAQIAAAKGNPALLAKLNNEKSLIEQSGKLITSEQAHAIAVANGQAAQDKATKSDQAHIDMLAREAAAQEAQIKNTLALADAYRVSDAAALIAEATAKAQSAAIKSRADQAAAIARQIELAIAQRVASAAQATASMNDQAAVQEKVNAMVEAGLVPASQAAQLIQDQTALLPLLAAQQAAQQTGDKAGYDAATKAIDDEKAAQDRLNASKADTQFNSATLSGDNQLAELREELTLIGQTDAARVHALATLKATQEADAMIAAGLDPAKAAAYVQQQIAIADKTQANKQATDAFNQSLSYQATIWGLIATNVQTAAQDMSDAFGTVGKSVGDLASALTNLQAQQKQQATDEAAQLKAASGNQQQYNQIVQEFATKGAITQVKAYGDMVEAAQGFFKSGSAGYKAMGAAEQAYRAVELALALKSAAQQIGLFGGVTAAKVAGSATSIATDTAETASSVANSAVRASADGAAAVAKTASSVPFPANIAAVAAVVALLASFGVAMIGSGGSSYTPPVTNTGTGTVLGDDTAQSASIKNALDQLTNVDTTTMNTSRSMLEALKSIDSQIGQLTNTLIDAGNIGSIVGVSNSGGGLFGTSKKIVGSGVSGGSESLGAIDSSGAYGTDYYADVQKTSHFLGISTGTSTSTKYASDGSDIDQQFGLILKGFYTSIEDAAGPLGDSTSAVEAKLNSFVVDIGKVDLTGLTGSQISDKLEAVFSAEGDKIAEAAIPGLEQYQQAGEGYLQTLVRVASTVETVTQTLDKLGESTSNLGISATMGIADQFDSLSDFSDAADSYFQDYYSQAEQAAAETSQLGTVFQSLGLQMPTTLDGFRQLVEAQDLTTTAGQQTYATLLQIAPAFSDLKTQLEGVKSAADIASEAADLQQQLWQAEGDTADLRAQELSQIDPSNQAIQQHIWALQDEADAEDAAAKVAQERSGIEQQLWQLEGDTADIRAAQISSLDASNQALQEQVYALTDQQAAAQAAAQAEQAAAQVTAQIAQERAGIQQTLWQLEGDTADQRAAELAGLDASNQALQEQVYALQDQQAATQAATAAAEAAAEQEQAVAQERNGLLQQLYQLTGNTAALRQMQLASLDPSNQALQEQIWAISDAQDAAQAASQLSDAWKTVGDSIETEIERIRGLTDTPDQSYASLLGQFNTATAEARAGDQTAAGNLPDLSQSLLTAAASAATSRQELDRIQAETAASLEATMAMITTATTTSDAATSSVLPASTDSTDSSTALEDQSWWNTFTANTAATSTSSSNDNVESAIATLTAKVEQLRAENNTGNATIAGNTGKSAGILDRVTRQSSGNAISTVAA